MHSISISLAKPGQVLAQPVTNPGGAVLCPAGYTLTEAALDRMRNAGVETVMLEGEAEGPSLEERLGALNRRFFGHRGSHSVADQSRYREFPEPGANALRDTPRATRY